MGQIYANVVLAYLNIHEGGMVTNVDFASPTNDEELGTKYIKYVVKKSERLNVV